ILHEAVLTESRTECQVLARVALIPRPQYLDALRRAVGASLADPATRILENPRRQRPFADADEDHAVERSNTWQVKLLIGFRVERNSLYRPQQRSTRRSIDICECAFAKGILSNRNRHRSRGRHVISGDRKSTRLNSSHVIISYAVFCFKKKSMKRRAPY